MLSGPALCAILVGLCVTLSPASCQLSQENIDTIVELHNRYRGQVVPSASNMIKVKWDEKLKLIAESYAVKCVWGHNPELPEMKLGENLFVMNNDFEADKAMQEWFNEHQDYTYNNNSCQVDRMCGHYTQMVWADTQSVGCASHRCETMEGLSHEKVTFLVCNYFPRGNFEHTKPYVEGEWCSKCRDSLPQCEENLCAPNVPEPTGDDEESFSPGTEWPSLQTTGIAIDGKGPESAQPTYISDPTATTTESSSPGTEWPSSQTTGMATDGKEPESAQPTYISDPTASESEEKGTKSMDGKNLDEEWVGKEKAAERETEMTTEHSGAKTGSISTSLTLVSSLVTLLVLRL